MSAWAARGQAVLVLDPGGVATTLAGSGLDGRTKAGRATDATLGSPAGVAYDAAGNLYIADTRNHQISRVDTSGQLTMVAGTGRQGFAGDGGQATAAELNAPAAIVVGADGDLWIADTGNHRVRRVSALDGTISTVAGTGVAGFSGDGGPAIAARQRSPTALALDGRGALFIADTGNHRVRKLQTDGTIVTAAGNGSEDDAGDGGSAAEASFLQPTGLTVLPDGTLLIVDRGARRVRAVGADGRIAPYAAAGGLALRRPEAVAADSAGSVYVADSGKQQVFETSADGASLLAGTGEQGRFAAGTATATGLDSPAMIAVSAIDGSVIFSDRRNHQVQRAAAATLAFGDVAVGSQSAARTVTLRNGGSTPLQVLAVDLPDGFSRSDGGSTCAATPFPLPGGERCTVGIAFAPKAQGDTSGVARIRLAGGAPQALFLSGSGSATGVLANSLTTLRSEGAISYAGAPVVLTVSVSGTLLTAPSGNVSFSDNGTALTTSTLTGGSATVYIASLQSGQHAMRATYSGDAVYRASTSSPVTLTVAPQPDFTLAAGAPSYSGRAGISIAVPLTLVPVNGTLNRAVQFAVTGLPSGSTFTFAPPTLLLGGDSTAVTFNVQMPATVSSRESDRPTIFMAVASLFGMVLLRRRAAYVAATAFALGLCGCGSGFRAGSSNAATGTTGTYTAVVTATTTGVLGAALTHSTTVGLVIVP